jgi:hypothetical protein
MRSGIVRSGGVTTRSCWLRIVRAVTCSAVAVGILGSYSLGHNIQLRSARGSHHHLCHRQCSDTTVANSYVQSMGWRERKVKFINFIVVLALLIDLHSHSLHPLWPSEMGAGGRGAGTTPETGVAPRRRPFGAFRAGGEPVAGAARQAKSGP